MFEDCLLGACFLQNAYPYPGKSLSAEELPGIILQ